MTELEVVDAIEVTQSLHEAAPTLEITGKKVTKMLKDVVMMIERTAEEVQRDITDPGLDLGHLVDITVAEKLAIESS